MRKRPRRAAFTPLQRPNGERRPIFPGALEHRTLKRNKFRTPNPRHCRPAGCVAREAGRNATIAAGGGSGVGVVHARVAGQSLSRRALNAPQFESQRDSVLQPWVGRAAGYPGIHAKKCFNPQRGCVIGFTTIWDNPDGVDETSDSGSQGSSCLATLGFVPLPRWGNPMFDVAAAGGAAEDKKCGMQNPKRRGTLTA